MKNLLLLFSLALFFWCCSSSKKEFSSPNKTISSNSDIIRIANDSLEYEIVIIDIGFNSWLVSNAQPRQFFTQSYMEARNKFWVIEWNNRAMQPSRFNPNLYQMQIDYQPNINYGYEVNYLLFNYLTYFQIVNRHQFGGFVARI